jgi:hypothetical protein
MFTCKCIHTSQRICTKYLFYGTFKRLAIGYFRFMFCHYCMKCLDCTYLFFIPTLTFAEFTGLNVRILRVKNKVIPMLNKSLRHKHLWGNGYIDPRFLYPGTSWRWVVSFKPRPLYPWENNSRYTLHRRLDVSQCRSGRRGKENIFYPTGTPTPASLSSGP